MALKHLQKYPLSFHRPSKWNRSYRLSKTAMAMVMLVCISFSQLNAQETGAVDIKESYPLIFKDFEHIEYKNDLIQFFEKNFSELINDIEKSTKQEEFQALNDFLKNEFKQYADVLPLKRSDPDELNKWVTYKQKEYQCMILGRKIQHIKKIKPMEEDVKQYEDGLKILLGQLLEVKLVKEQADIEELENRLENLKQIHHIRMKSKKKILQNRFDELVGEKQLYQW